MTLGSDPAGEVDFQPQLQDVIEPGKFGEYAEQPVVYSTQVAAPAKVPWWQPTWQAVSEPFKDVLTTAPKTGTQIIGEASRQLRDVLLEKIGLAPKAKPVEQTEGGNVYPNTNLSPPAGTTRISSIPEKIVYALTGQAPAAVVSAPAAAAAGGSVLVIGLMIIGAAIWLSRSK